MDALAQVLARHGPQISVEDTFTTLSPTRLVLSGRPGAYLSMNAVADCCSGTEFDANSVTMVLSPETQVPTVHIQLLDEVAGVPPTVADSGVEIVQFHELYTQLRLPLDTSAWGIKIDATCLTVEAKHVLRIRLGWIQTILATHNVMLFRDRLVFTVKQRRQPVIAPPLGGSSGTPPAKRRRDDSS